MVAAGSGALVDAGGDVAGADLGEVGEHRTLGAFHPVLHGEKVISGGSRSIQDSLIHRRGTIMSNSRGRFARMVLATALLGLGVTACTPSTRQSLQTPGSFTTTTASPESAATSSSPTGSTTTNTPAPSALAPSATASASNVAAIGPVWPIEARTIAAAASGRGVPVLTRISTQLVRGKGVS